MNRHRVLLTSCLVATMILWGAAAAAAQMVPAGPKIRISDATETLFGRPAVAFDAAGNSVVVWGFIEETTELLQEARIYGRFYGPDGEPAAPPQALDGGPAEFQFDPDVAALREERFLVVWSRWEMLDPRPKFRAYDVFGQLVDSGRPQGSRFLINERTPFWQIFPAVAADGRGRSFVVWAWNDVGDQGPWPENVSGRLLLPDGAPAAGEVRVNRRATSPVESRYEPAVAVASDRDGESLVVWASRGRIFARRYDPRGRPRGPEVRMDEVGGRINATPAVAAGTDGSFVVLWASQRDHRLTPPKIVSRWFEGGGPSGPRRRLGTGPLPSSFGVLPAVTRDAEGRFVATWTVLDRRYSHPRVAVRQLTPEGRPMGPIRIVSFGSSSDVAAGPDGDVLVVWRDALSGGGPERRIAGKRYRAR